MALWPIHEIDVTCGSRDGCVKPSEVVFGEHVFCHVALVDVDFFPLSALGFVAGHGVGVLYLQGVVVLVFAHGTVEFFFGA